MYSGTCIPLLPISSNSCRILTHVRYRGPCSRSRDVLGVSASFSCLRRLSLACSNSFGFTLSQRKQLHAVAKLDLWVGSSHHVTGTVLWVGLTDLGPSTVQQAHPKTFLEKKYISEMLYFCNAKICVKGLLSWMTAVGYSISYYLVV